MKVNDKIGVITILTVSCILLLYLFYGLATSLSIFFFKRETTAKVIEWVEKSGKVYVTYEYKNENGNISYIIEKEVRRRSVQTLKDKSELTIKYSTIFPSYTEIEGMSEYGYIYILIGISLVFVVAYKCVLVLRNKAPISDLV